MTDQSFPIPPSVQHLAHINRETVVVSSEEPLPLIRTLERPCEYPVDLLGETLSSACKALSQAVQVPSAICAQSLLAAASLLAQGHINVEVNGMVWPCSLFFITIAESGDRKSAVDRIVLQKIKDHERHAMETYGKERQKYKTELRYYDHSNKSTIADNAKEPVVPINPTVLIQEPTYEGLIKHYAQGNPYVGLFSDEGGRMLGGHGMNKDNLLKTIAGLSELWDGSAISRMRAQEASEKLYDKRLSIHLMVQNIVTKKLFEDPILKGQGFLARFLLWAPDSLAGSRSYQDCDANTLPEVIAYSRQVECLLALPYPVHPQFKDWLQPRTVPLSSDSKVLFAEFHDWVEERLGRKGEFDSIRPFASKAPQMAARIAGCLQFFNSPHLTEIDDKYMGMGINLMIAYLQETKRLWNASGVDKDLEYAEKLRIWLIDNGYSSITGKELYQKGPSFVRSKRSAEKLSRILVEHGHLKFLAQDSQSLAKQKWEVVFAEKPLS